MRRLVALSQGVAPAWVLRDDAGRPALLDVDWEGGRYWYAGRSYASAALLYAALGTVTEISARVITIGPNSDAAAPEMVVGAELETSSDIAAWTVGSNTTVSQVAGGMRVAGSGARGYVYQALATEVGRPYRVGVAKIGAAGVDGEIRVGNTPQGTDHVYQSANTEAGAYFSFVASATTTYITLMSHGSFAGRDYNWCRCRAATPFQGFSRTAGSMMAKWLGGSVSGTTDQILEFASNGSNSGSTNKIAFSRQTGGANVSANVRTSSTDQAAITVSNCTAVSILNSASMAWASNDIAVSVNGSAEATDTSATLGVGYDRLYVGHEAGAGANATMHRFAYFPRRIANLNMRPWYISASDRIHILGDSFATTVLQSAIQALYPSRFVSIDGVGGSTGAEQLARYQATPALRDRTLVWMDGGQGAGEDTITALAGLIAAAGHTRIIRVQPSPGVTGIAGSAERIAWDAAQAAIDSYLSSALGIGHIAECLTALKAANDGSGGDLTDVANNIVPRSLRIAALDMHETAAGLGIRAAQVKALTDAYPSLLA